MTSKQQVKRLLAPLLEKRQDLVLIDRALYLVPVKHLVRGIYFDATWSRDLFRPKWGIRDVTTRREGLDLWQGDWISRGTGTSWHWSESDTQHDLLEVLESQVIPRLVSIQTIEQFAHQAKFIPMPDYHAESLHESLPCVIAAGRLDVARQMATLMLPYRIEDNPDFTTPKEREPFLQIRRLLPPLADSDIPAMAKILWEFADFTIRHNKLEPYWERTPLPLETMV